MKSKISFTILISSVGFLLLPSLVLADQPVLKATAALVVDKQSGERLLTKNTSEVRAPASLTKLVTALTFLALKPNLKKVVTISTADEVGGARLAVRAGASFKCGDLLRASLIGSLNNTTNALVSCSGLSRDKFVQRMNDTVSNLGTLRANFFEPSGIDVRNQITAEDYVLIMQAAFANSTIAQIVQTSTYSFSDSKKRKYTVHNSDKLLGDKDMTVIGGKTGFINESLYNFAAEVKNSAGRHLFVVILGAPDRATSFAEAKQAALWAWAQKL